MPFARYASLADRSRGRRVAEAASRTRSAFQRDRDRIIHSMAFRRLKHKTQVFVAVEGDHYRTRLTHSLEVAQVGRSVARVLALDEDLTEALALAHDLGHTAFGHAGESALDQCMAPYGGFDHNAHGLRLVTALEQRYPAFDGLNLSWETLEGLIKHNGPLLRPGITRQHLAWGIDAYDQQHDLWLAHYAGLEAQVAALADDIAYNNHDLDDGLRAGLFSIEETLSVPLLDNLWREVRAAWPLASIARLTAELIRTLIGLMVDDLITTTRAALSVADPADADTIRKLGRPLACFSTEMQRSIAGVRQFLSRAMYHHPDVEGRTQAAGQVINTLFHTFMADEKAMPEHWQPGFAGLDTAQRARRICDFIAGCTDQFALRCYEGIAGSDALAVFSFDKQARGSPQAPA